MSIMFFINQQLALFVLRIIIENTKRKYDFNISNLTNGGLLTIEKADIGYAVGNAIDALKAKADRVTARVDECAIARIIDELEREFTNSN